MSPLVGLLLLCGLVALWLGRRRLGGGCVALALGLLLLFAWQPFAAVLIQPLEQRYPALVDAPVDADVEYVVVLGAGHVPDPAVPVSSRLDAMALFRAQGLDPVPAPTEYMAPARPPGAGWNVYYLRPSATGLRMTERAFHEYLGLAWGRVQGIL